jgi:hypothetical protein
MVKEYGKESASTGYLKRIALKFAQHLIAEKKQEEFIELLNFKLMKAPALRKLLEHVQDLNMPTLSAYILQAISECEAPRNSLRL